MARQASAVLGALGLIFCQASKTASPQHGAEGAAGLTAVAFAAQAASSDWLKPATAKAHLAKARQKAREWQADAELYEVSTSFAVAEGTASPKMPWGYVTSWEYFFYSKSANRALAVDVMEKGLATKEDVTPFAIASQNLKPLADNFVDSDRALEQGRRAGWKGPTPHITVIMHLSNEPNLPPVWHIQAGRERCSVDAISGKVLP